jgi:Putative zinc-finger
MRDMNERPVCHRAEDLVTYLYGEAGEADAQDFRNHLLACDACRSEFAVFNQVHDSIVWWRNEALGLSPHSAPVTQPAITASAPIQNESQISAWKALKTFFEFSPLWLRAATAFAVIVFCVMAIVLVMRGTRQPAPVAANNPELKYTRKDMDEAYEKGRSQAQVVIASPPKDDVVTAPRPGSDSVNRPQPKKIKPRGLTAREREQLAADLRLMPAMDDDEQPFGISDQPNQ